MNIIVPPAISGLGPMLTEFFEGMLHKLNVNSHKDAINEDDIDSLINKMMAELQEFKDQRAVNPTDMNMLSELFDISNFSFLLYAFLRSRGVMDLRERFIEEFFDIDVKAGRIFCKKTRSGSPLKVGDEVTGICRNGVCHIRVQHSHSGAAISMPRRDIIWWAANRRWPERPLEYLKQTLPSVGVPVTHSRDNISNLRLSDPKPGGTFPFVSQFKPRGREDSKNFGKWRYQRRHGFRLVVVGYWDTDAEAAREGLKAWKAKIQETNGA